MNGPGTRAVVWVQGCPFRCKGCWNPETRSFKPNKIHTVDEVFAWILQVKDEIDGVTFLGGEPFCQAEALAELGQKCQAIGLTVMTYTGYIYEKLLSGQAPKGAKELLGATDLLVDGPYIEHLKEPGLVWRGSSNQRLIHLTDKLKPKTDISIKEKQNLGFEVVVSDDGSIGLTMDQPQDFDLSKLQQELQRLGVEVALDNPEVSCSREKTADR